MSDHRKSMQRQLFATEKELYSESSVSALVYDMQTELFSKECDGDVQFYLEAAGKFARVLDLGTGTGRVAWPMAEAGCSVVGLDVSKYIRSHYIAVPILQSSYRAGRSVALLEEDPSAFAPGWQGRAAFESISN